MEDDSHVVSLYLMQTNYSTGVKERVDCFRPTEEYERKAQTNNYCKCTSMNLEALTVGIYIYILNIIIRTVWPASMIMKS